MTKEIIVKLTIEVPSDFDRDDERQLDDWIADAICKAGYELINSAKYRDVKELLIEKEIELEANALLTGCLDCYAGTVWTEIKDFVIENVKECSDISSGGDFTTGDVALAIGRAFMERMGKEV